jgi:hypothetical protein
MPALRPITHSPAVASCPPRKGRRPHLTTVLPAPLRFILGSNIYSSAQLDSERSIRTAKRFQGWRVNCLSG